MTIKGVLEICDNCQQRKNKAVVSLSALFASGASPIRSMRAKDSKLQFFSNFCSTRQSAVELRKNRMWGVFWCVSAEARPETTSHHQSKEEQTCWKMSAVMFFTGGNWQSFIAELTMCWRQVIMKQKKTLFLFAPLPGLAIQACGTWYFCIFRWQTNKQIWILLFKSFCDLFSVHMHSLHICLVHVPSFQTMRISTRSVKLRNTIFTNWKKMHFSYFSKVFQL